MLSMVDRDEVSVLVDAQSLETQNNKKKYGSVSSTTADTEKELKNQTDSDDEEFGDKGFH